MGEYYLGQGVPQGPRHVVPHPDTAPGGRHCDVSFTRHTEIKF